MGRTLSRTLHTIAWLLLAAGVAGVSILLYIHFAPNAALPYLSSPSSKTSVDGTRKTAEQQAVYTVPPSHPRQLSIPSLGVTANILTVGTLSNGAMDAPSSAWDVGWYDKSALPGSGNGALLIDGHVNDSLDQPGIFSSLHTLKPGDEIEIERGDGRLFVYAVTSVEQTPVDKVDMSRLLRSVEHGKEGLNIITCGGRYDTKNKTYTDRILVYTTRISAKR